MKMSDTEQSSQNYLVRTMSDTVETDIQRVHVISNKVLECYGKDTLTFEQLRKIAEGPFDLFLIPIVFEEDYRHNRNIIFNEQRRQEIRNHALRIAKSHGYDTHPPALIPGIEDSLRETRDAGLRNILMTSGGRRFKHQAMEDQGLGGYFDEIIDRDQNYFVKEQGLYHLFRQRKTKRLQVILLSGSSSYIRAGNNLESCKVAGNVLEVSTVALSTEYSYSDEETLSAAKPKILLHSLDELLPALKKLGFVSG
ncbi:MAG: HAD hydrolase-like protein [Candidatus Binatia bacterium]